MLLNKIEKRKSQILTSCSNAAVQGQRFSKMYVRWIVFPFLFRCFRTFILLLLSRNIIQRCSDHIILLEPIKKAIISSPNKSVGSPTSTQTVISSFSTSPSLSPSSSSSSPSIVKSTRKLFVGDVCSRSAKKASHLINWFKIEDIRRELEKYNEKHSKIEDDVELFHVIYFGQQ